MEVVATRRFNTFSNGLKAAGTAVGVGRCGLRNDESVGLDQDGDGGGRVGGPCHRTETTNCGLGRLLLLLDGIVELKEIRLYPPENMLNTTNLGKKTIFYLFLRQRSIAIPYNTSYSYGTSMYMYTRIHIISLISKNSHVLFIVSIPPQEVGSSLGGLFL